MLGAGIHCHDPVVGRRWREGRSLLYRSDFLPFSKRPAAISKIAGKKKCGAGGGRPVVSRGFGGGRKPLEAGITDGTGPSHDTKGLDCDSRTGVVHPSTRQLEGGQHRKNGPIFVHRLIQRLTEEWLQTVTRGYSRGEGIPWRAATQQTFDLRPTPEGQQLPELARGK